MQPLKEIRFRATNADLSNLKVLARLLPSYYSTSDIIGEGIRCLRSKVEADSKEVLNETAEQSTVELFG